MGEIIIKTDPAIEKTFANYPESAKSQLLNLRKLIIASASEIDGILELEETLRWGEPSFITKHGSTLRMDWKPRAPGEYAMYFQCTTRLVETFKMVFGNLFQYEDNRAIIFQLDQKIPEEALKACIKATLNYHKVKHLITLGL